MFSQLFLIKQCNVNEKSMLVIVPAKPWSGGKTMTAVFLLNKLFWPPSEKVRGEKTPTFKTRVVILPVCLWETVRLLYPRSHTAVVVGM